MNWKIFLLLTLAYSPIHAGCGDSSEHKLGWSYTLGMPLNASDEYVCRRGIGSAKATIEDRFLKAFKDACESDARAKGVSWTILEEWSARKLSSHGEWAALRESPEMEFSGFERTDGGQSFVDMCDMENNFVGGLGPFSTTASTELKLNAHCICGEKVSTVKLLGAEKYFISSSGSTVIPVRLDRPNDSQITVNFEVVPEGLVAGRDFSMQGLEGTGRYFGKVRFSRGQVLKYIPVSIRSSQAGRLRIQLLDATTDGSNDSGVNIDSQRASFVLHVNNGVTCNVPLSRKDQPAACPIPGLIAAPVNSPAPAVSPAPGNSPAPAVSPAPGNSPAPAVSPVP